MKKFIKSSLLNCDGILSTDILGYVSLATVLNRNLELLWFIAYQFDKFAVCWSEPLQELVCSWTFSFSPLLLEVTSCSLEDVSMTVVPWCMVFTHSTTHSHTHLLSLTHTHSHTN